MTRCPSCLYSLQGLPSEGRCPECGNPFAPDHYVLTGQVGAPNRRATSRNSAAVGYIAGGVAMFAMAGFTASDLPGAQLILITGGVLFFALAFAARRWGVGTDEGVDCLVYLAPHGYGQGSPRRGVSTIRPWTRGLEIDLRLVHDRWWLSIRDGFSQHVLAQLRESEPTVMKIRDALQAWQGSRVCVEH